MRCVGLDGAVDAGHIAQCWVVLAMPARPLTHHREAEGESSFTVLRDADADPAPAHGTGPPQRTGCLAGVCKCLSAPAERTRPAAPHARAHVIAQIGLGESRPPSPKVGAAAAAGGAALVAGNHPSTDSPPSAPPGPGFAGRESGSVPASREPSVVSPASDPRAAAALVPDDLQADGRLREALVSAPQRPPRPRDSASGGGGVLAPALPPERGDGAELPPERGEAASGHRTLGQHAGGATAPAPRAHTPRVTLMHGSTLQGAGRQDLEAGREQQVRGGGGGGAAGGLLGGPPPSSVVEEEEMGALAHAETEAEWWQRQGQGLILNQLGDWVAAEPLEAVILRELPDVCVCVCVCVCVYIYIYINICTCLYIGDFAGAAGGAALHAGVPSRVR